MVNEEKRPLKVFLCHASGDKPPVRDLYKHLTAEGVDAWLDQEKLLPGQDWRLEIPRAVHEADVVLICLSKKSITKEGYVQKEIKFALDIAEEKPEGAIFLIPARLEECVVPERLSRWHWVDLYEENGFIKLLRSLKLRANTVGAVIEPLSYEDADKERERRLDQLYMEGLSAFYTEDWDRACHCFQAILSEQPNHRKAAEKLAEAECQMHLTRLYAQATEAYRSENWQIAIGALEELSQKSADYKDAAQLLRDARRQKQLKELYAEAKALHAAQKWQAVVKVIKQIYAIEPNYPDTEGLLPSAQKEVAELERLAELDEQYNRALREMESGNWYEARRFLESIHKSQTGFLETEKLLRKVENEISREEEKRKQADQINMLYEQAHGLLRAKKWRNALDKFEQIRKLDEHFPDTDGITEKAQKELEREEQEADRQNRLAALYAEAVRLLKEEKYQEALDKWQEVKALDSKYPDRQWVQKTARGKLAETAKPIRIKPRIVITKSFWTGIAGLVVIAVIASLVLSSKNSPGILPIPTSAPISNIIVNPSATGGYVDPTMYDDFDKPAYDGKYNTSLWQVDSDGPKFSVSQGDGKLSMTVDDKNGVGLSFTYATINKPTFFEARGFLDPTTTDKGVELYIILHGRKYGREQGYSHCGVYGSDKQSIKCWSEYYGEHVESALGLDGISPGWHVFRFEIEPETMVITYIIDGRQVGLYDPGESIPDHFNEFKKLAFNFEIVLVNYGPSKAPVGYFDYVRVGELAP